MCSLHLLEDFQTYFKQAQSSWDNYFSKWESLAKGEEINEEVDSLPVKQVKTPRFSTVRQLRKKSISLLNRKKFNPRRKRKYRAGKVRIGKARDRNRETEIIHATENQTNSECEIVNNKHFEADLKAIFVKILSENDNQMGMFSVLSRTFSGETVTCYSVSSVTAKKNQFSGIDYNGGISPRWQMGEESPVRSCANVTERHTSNVPVIRSGVSPKLKETGSHLEEFARGNALVTPVKSSRTPQIAKAKCLSEKATKRRKSLKNSFLESSDEESEDDEADSTPRKFLKILCTPKRTRRSVKQQKTMDSDNDDDDCFRIIDRVKTDKNTQS